MIRSNRHILYLLLFFSCGQPLAAAAGLDAYAKTERFSWAEYDAGGKLLQENGPIITVGLTRKTVQPDQSFTKAELAYFGGTVAYDGATWGGTPVTSDTDYRGFKGEYSFYHPAGGEGGYTFFGLGYKQWLRDLISTPVSQGYREQWKSLYARFGFRQESARLRIEAGLKYPFYNESRVAAFGSTARPGRQASFFGEADWAVAKHLELSLTYDSMKFPASDSVYAPQLGQYVYQPDSKSDSWGLALRAKF